MGGIIREEMARLSRDTIMMEEVLEYLMESLVIIEIPPEPPEQSGRALYDRLQIHVVRDGLNTRTIDLQKNMAGTRHQLGVLRDMTNIVSENKMFDMKETVNHNTEDLCLLMGSQDEANFSVEIIQVMLGGMLAFDLMDRLTGEWSVVNTAWMSGIVESLIRNSTLIWFLINLLMWAMLHFLVSRYFSKKVYNYAGKIEVWQSWMTVVNLKMLKQYVLTQDLMTDERAY